VTHFEQGASARRPLNGLAVASLIVSILGACICIGAPVGAILGHIALRSVRQRQQSGRGVAIAGTIVGWLVTLLYVCGVGLFVAIRPATAVAILTGIGDFISNLVA
jgi:uncharacterized membrane protein YeaQ/YmgE (transglycosylase-associated protein family)